jgi:uncharacterized membrane protein
MNTLGAGVAFAAGAAFMYSFDPNHGRRRRARVRNEVDHLTHAVPRSLQKASADSAQRVRGMLKQLRRGPPAEVDDEVLAGRVRASLGRHCSHPHAVRVISHSGVVELRGPILAGEADRVVQHLRRVPGVRLVRDALERHTGPDGVGGLMGRAAHARPGFWRRRWPISLRWAAGSGAAGLAAAGLIRGGLRGTAMTLMGGAGILRAIGNRPIAALLGIGEDTTSGIDVAKTVTIEAPAAEVFSYFVAFENFPKFMRHVREVKRLDDNRWHWTVEGAGGVTFDWDGLVTRYLAPSRIAWTSTANAAIRHHGEAFFEPMSDRTTRMTVRLVYHPPLGAVGHAVAKLLGADPKRELDDDLLRFKSLLETGKAKGRAGSIRRSDVIPTKA